MTTVESTQLDDYGEWKEFAFNQTGHTFNTYWILLDKQSAVNG